MNTVVINMDMLASRGIEALEGLWASLIWQARAEAVVATFARWLNRNGASYDNDIWSQCDLDDFARRAWNAGCRAAGRRSRK